MSTATALVPAELLAEVRAKFLRYGSDAGAEKLLSLSGWRYFVKSCPSGPLVGVPEAALEAYFLGAAGADASKRRCASYASRALRRALRSRRALNAVRARLLQTNALAPAMSPRPQQAPL